MGVLCIRLICSFCVIGTVWWRMPNMC